MRGDAPGRFEGSGGGIPHVETLPRATSPRRPPSEGVANSRDLFCVGANHGANAKFQELN